MKKTRLANLTGGWAGVAAGWLGGWASVAGARWLGARLILAGLILGVIFLPSGAIERPTFEDFAAGYEKNKASMLNYEGLPAFALGENTLAVLKTPGKKLNKYVKYDPFLNLYLVRTDFSLIPTPMIDEQNITRNDWVGIWDPAKPYIGHIKYLAQGLNERDQLDFTSKIGLLGTPCCEMLGIALADNSFIGNRYLKHFVKYPDVYWGDIGVDFALRENKIYVANVRKSGQFLVNDEVLSVDGKPVRDLRVLNEKVLFADRGSTLYFELARDNEDLNVSVAVFDKDLGKFKSPEAKTRPKAPPSLRTNLGLTLNSALVVTAVDASSNASRAGFLVGDKILRINNEELRTFTQVQAALAGGSDFNFLIERDESKLPTNRFENSLGRQSKANGKFQFFIRVSK